MRRTAVTQSVAPRRHGIVDPVGGVSDPVFQSPQRAGRSHPNSNECEHRRGEMNIPKPVVSHPPPVKQFASRDEDECSDDKDDEARMNSGDKITKKIASGHGGK